MEFILKIVIKTLKNVEAIKGVQRKEYFEHSRLGLNKEEMEIFTGDLEEMFNISLCNCRLSSTDPLTKVAEDIETILRRHH